MVLVCNVKNYFNQTGILGPVTAVFDSEVTSEHPRLLY